MYEVFVLFLTTRLCINPHNKSTLITLGHYVKTLSHPFACFSHPLGFVPFWSLNLCGCDFPLKLFLDGIIISVQNACVPLRSSSCTDCWIHKNIIRLCIQFPTCRKYGFDLCERAAGEKLRVLSYPASETWTFGIVNEFKYFKYFSASL